MTDQTDIEPLEGKTEIDDGVKLEVEIQALAVLQEITQDIARRISKLTEAGTRIIVADEAWPQAIASFHQIEVHLDWLLHRAEEAVGALPTGTKAVEKAAMESAAGAIVGGVKSVARILSYFRVDTTIKGRQIDIDPASLHASFGSALIEQSFEVVLSDQLPMIAGDGTRRLLRRINRLSSLSLTLRGNPETISLADEIDKGLAAMNAAAENDQISSLHRAFRGAQAEAILSDGKQTLLLSARVVASGSNYIIKKHLFNTLFLGNQLSYSAGAAVAFSLIDGRTHDLVLSDVVYKIDGSRAFRDWSFAASLNNLCKTTSRPIEGQNAPVSGFVAENDQTPNVGDDFEAAEDGDVPLDETIETEKVEAARPWRAAKSLLVLRDQVNVMAPRRSKASDGTIGDPAHQSRKSDHNAWVDDGDLGVVTALDITHDPVNGCDATSIAESIVASRDTRVKYIIWNKKILSSSQQGETAPWTWRDYRGSNPHSHHVHLSVRPEKSSYDRADDWMLPEMVG